MQDADLEQIMSGSRGRKVTSSRPGDPVRWPNQQPYYNQNASGADPRSGWDNWNFPPPSSGYNAWPHNPNLHQVWPSPHYRGRGFYSEDHLPRNGDFDQFQHRYPNSFTPPSHFAERSLAHLNQTPLNELSSSGQSSSRDVPSTCDPSSSKQPNSAKYKPNVQSARSKGPVEKAAATKTRVPSNPLHKEISSASKNLVSVSVPEKPNVPVKSTSFMPPNDDLRNKVKASLEKIAATKDQVPVRTATSTPAEQPVPSSPHKVRESRIPATEASPSSRHSITVAAGSHRRTSQSSSTSNSGANNETTNNPLEGLGFIQNTSENLESVSQANRLRNSSGSSAYESEPLTSVPKEKLNKYIRSMDNNQRRQLVEQPRSIISQYMLNHLVQENQTARARQLSSIRYRLGSNELESNSKAENTVVLSEELVDEIKELLSRNDEETAKQPDSEEEEIQVLEPPPKVPPLCIDLDLDDKPTSPSPNQKSISDLKDTTSDFVERELDARLSAASRPAVAPTPDPVRVSQALLVPPPVSEATTSSQVPCPVPLLSQNISCPVVTHSTQLSHQPSPLKESSATSTSTVPSFSTKVSAGKKSFLDRVGKNQRKKERKEKKAQEQKQSTEKDKTKSKKTKKKDKKKSPTKKGTGSMSNSTPAQNASVKLPEVVDLNKSMDQAGTSNHFQPFPDSGEGRSALNFLLTDLQSEEQQGKDRIALIDRTIEELQLERKALTDKVLSLKQQQFDLLRSAMSTNQFASDSASRSSESTTTTTKTPAAMESAQPMEESSPVQPIPPAASTELLSLMHQLEENGLQVALGDMEVVPSDPVVNVSVGAKRKRIPSDESKQKKKCTPTSSPSRNAVDIPPVEKPEQVPTNVAVVQPMQSNSTPAVPQTMSISQINQISLTISSVISQSVESSCPKKTPPPAIFPNKSKNAASPSESSPTTEESQDQTKEIFTGKAQAASLSPKVVEPTVLQAKVAEFKVAEQVVEPQIVEPKVVKSKVVQPKVADPKIVQTKKSATAANASKTTQKPTDVNSRSLENCRTYSRREESSTQKATPKPSKVNTQPSETASKLPAPAAESNQVKATAAATLPVSTSKAASSPAPAKQPASTAACETISTDPVLLRPHLTAVRCVHICGPCAFTASEDGTVHIYDLKTNSLSMRILGHTHPVTWLYGISLNTSSEVLSTIQSTTEYLNHVTLITGSEDAHIRQFALDSGSLIHERFCEHALTCTAGHVAIAKLYVGTTEGVIFTYNPRINSIRINSFKVNGEVICMKIVSIRGKRAIIVAARRMDPIVFDLETEVSLFTLASNIPSSSFYCISSSSKYVFCCDANKNVFKFDTNSDNMYQTETLPSAAVSSFHDGKRFLVLGCMDGVIRVLDTMHKPPYPMFTLPGQGLKTITCMKVVGDTIVGGSLNGEVLYCRLPNLEALSKASL